MSSTTKVSNPIEDRKKRARKKYLGNNLALALINANRESPLAPSYWRTYHCRDIIEISGGKRSSNYCKNRWCATCQSIRTAKLINGYREALEALVDPYFVTLTAPTIPADYLPQRISDFGEKWRKITKGAVKRGLKIQGIRKAECTIRPNGLYHYHFHIIVGGEREANYIMSRWLSLNPDANVLANDLRPADGTRLMELFKYFTKLTVKVNGVPRLMDPVRLDVIFRAMKGVRVFQPFGGIKAISEDDIDIASVGVEEMQEGRYIWDWCDWESTDGVAYSGYNPDDDEYVWI